MKADGGEPPGSLLGLAHVASCSFLASRLVLRQNKGMVWLVTSPRGVAGLGRLYGHGLRPCLSRLPAARLESMVASSPAAPGGSVGKYLPGPSFLRLFFLADGSTDG